MSEDRLDAAIDQAIRELLNVDAPQMRARVMARLLESRQVGWRMGVLPSVRVSWLPLPITAVVAIVALLVPRTMVAPSVMMPTPAHTHGATAARLTLPRVPPAFPTIASLTPSGERTMHASQRSRVGLGLDAWPESQARAEIFATVENEGQPAIGVAPLDAIAPIRVDAARRPDIGPPAMSVEPMAPIAQLQVAPLTSPEGRH